MAYGRYGARTAYRRSYPSGCKYCAGSKAGSRKPMFKQSYVAKKPWVKRY